MIHGFSLIFVYFKYSHSCDYSENDRFKLNFKILLTVLKIKVLKKFEKTIFSFHELKIFEKKLWNLNCDIQKHYKIFGIGPLGMCLTFFL